MQIVTPKITLIGKTIALIDELEAIEADWLEAADAADVVNSNGELLIEFAGRECYQSWGRPNPKTATLAGYIKNLIMQRHFSVLEHVVATFRFENVSRSLTHELVRHRHFSYSQLSQRYVDGSDAKIVVHPDIKAILDKENSDPEGHIHSHFVGERLDDVVESVERFYKEVDSAMGHQPIKVRRGAARGALPNMTATNIVVTGNLRAWRHFILMRCTQAAEIEIRDLALKVFNRLALEFPNAFFDFKVDGQTITSDYMEAE